jgi:hypothetical protein
MKLQWAVPSFHIAAVHTIIVKTYANRNKEALLALSSLCSWLVAAFFDKRCLPVDADDLVIVRWCARFGDHFQSSDSIQVGVGWSDTVV